MPYNERMSRKGISPALVVALLSAVVCLAVVILYLALYH